MDSTVQELELRKSAAKEIRRPFEGQWFVNLAMYLGHQWVSFDGNRLWEPPLEPWQVKLVDNRIQPAVRVDIAKMTKTRPTFVGVPVNQDDEALAAARLTERGLDFQWNELDLQRKLRAALLWSRNCSIGYWKVCWDKGLGRELIVLKRDGEILKDDTGAPLQPQRLQGLPAEMTEGIREERMALGDIRVDVRSPFMIFPDPIAGEEGVESCEWVIEEVVQSLEYARSRFGYDGAADSEASTGTMEAMMPAGIGKRGAAGYRGVKISEYWAKPSSEFPRGKHVVWAGNEILSENDIPYPWLPYVGFRGTPVPGRFYPDAPVTPLVSPQVELNKRKAQIAENAARIGNPPLARAEGTTYEYSGLPGGELVYQDTGSPNAMPQFLSIPEVPGYIREDIQRIEASIQEISGQHDVSRGVVPSGVTAASAINLLQEADDTRLGPDIQDMEKSIADAGKRIVWLMQHYYSDERVIRIAGEDGAWDIVPFRGKQLEGNADVQVQAGSAMPRSKAAKQAAIQQVLTLAIQNGLPLKERNLRRVLQEYEVGGIERMFADLGDDERQIQRENMAMSRGEEIEINSFDNDEAHVEGHTQFQKSSAYEQLDEATQNFIDAHVDAHRQRLMQMQPPPPPEGAPPGAGPGAPPPGMNGAGPMGPPMPVPFPQ